jgi:hypothetical protein
MSQLGPEDPEDAADEAATTDRRERVGEPVVRADPEITGTHASDAVDFDPEDPESVDLAAETLREFADAEAVDGDDSVAMLRGAAACAALVRAVGSYRAAAERAGDAPVSFIRKWARVHDLPQSVRRHVARGDIAPSAAKHIARVEGTDRLDLAWATLDHDLTVREVRSLATEVRSGTPAVEALRESGVDPPVLDLSLSPEAYRELRREASMRNCDPGEVVSEALEARYSE